MSVRQMLLGASATLAACAFAAGVCEAQTRPAPAPKPPARPHRPAPHAGSVEVSGGLAWDAGFEQGTQAANETRNIATGTGPYPLFTTDNSVRAAYGASVRVGYFVTSSLAIEGGLQFLKPEAASRISGDTEGAQGLTATETFSRYVFDVSAVWHLQKLAFAARRGLPFVFGGGGYVRELHDGGELLETGSEFHAGAGLKYFLSQGSHRYGLRGDVSFENRAGGFDYSDGRRTLARVGASLFVVF